ncbi:MAG: hypothetical protein WAT58_08990 [Candidatus Dormiibacterota bacterium]
MNRSQRRITKLTLLLLGAVALAGCDVGAQKLAGGGSVPPPANPPSPRPISTHAIQPDGATTDAGGTATMDPATGHAWMASQFAVTGSATALTITFRTPNTEAFNTFQQLVSNGQRHPYRFVLTMPGTSQDKDNYTYDLTNALVTQVQQTTASSGGLKGPIVYQVTLAAGSWSWQYQPVDASGYAVGIPQQGSP